MLVPAELACRARFRTSYDALNVVLFGIGRQLTGSHYYGIVIPGDGRPQSSYAKGQATALLEVRNRRRLLRQHCLSNERDRTGAGHALDGPN